MWFIYLHVQNFELSNYGIYTYIHPDQLDMRVEIIRLLGTYGIHVMTTNYCRILQTVGLCWTMKSGVSDYNEHFPDLKIILELYTQSGMRLDPQPLEKTQVTFSTIEATP